MIAVYPHFFSGFLHLPLAQSPAKGDIKGDIGDVGVTQAWRGICSRQGG
jgi:hypothetical protein